MNESKEKNLRWIDPPSGWKYGFPKLWDGNGDMREWIIRKGYPKHEIDRLGEHFYIRQWEPSIEDDPED